MGEVIFSVAAPEAKEVYVAGEFNNWQLDTGSYHSIVNVNSAIDLIRGMCGRIAMIPLSLTLEPREVTIKGEKGQVKKTVNVLQIRTDATLAEIQRIGAMPASQVMLPPPDEAKPDDADALVRHSQKLSCFRQFAASRLRATCTQSPTRTVEEVWSYLH